MCFVGIRSFSVGMIIKGFCSIVLYESRGAYSTGILVEEFCLLYLNNSSAFSKDNSEREKKYAEWRKDEIVDNKKGSIRKDLNIEFVHRFKKYLHTS